MSDDEMRAEFEAWAVRNNCGTTQAKGNDGYWLFHTQLAWIAWRAAYAAGQKAEREAIFIEWENGELLAAEVERLRAELELSKANAESLKKALHEVQNAAIRLGDQVDDAKAELAAAKADGAMVEATVAENELLRVTNERLAADLAAAKAASVVPVEAIDCYFDEFPNLGVVRVICKSGEDAKKVVNWLRDRMKDTTPPAT